MASRHATFEALSRICTNQTNKQTDKKDSQHKHGKIKINHRFYLESVRRWIIH